MELTGSGKLLNYFETANVRWCFAAREITAAGQFNSVIFSGMSRDMLHEECATFKAAQRKAGDSRQHPVIAEKSLASAHRGNQRTTISGRATLKIGFPASASPGDARTGLPYPGWRASAVLGARVVQGAGTTARTSARRRVYAGYNQGSTSISVST